MKWTSAGPQGKNSITEGGDDLNKIENDSVKPNKSEDLSFAERVENAFEMGFVNDVLPKLPLLRNGMRLMGCQEPILLGDNGELFKLKAFRPDQPLATSEIFEDGAMMRFTNLSKLVNDDFIISKFKVELAVYKAGLVDEDMTGLKAIERVLEMEDVANLTIKPFLERKLKGKIIRKDYTDQGTDNKIKI